MKRRLQKLLLVGLTLSFYNCTNTIASLTEFYESNFAYFSVSSKPLNEAWYYRWGNDIASSDDWSDYQFGYPIPNRTGSDIVQLKTTLPVHDTNNPYLFVMGAVKSFEVLIGNEVRYRYGKLNGSDGEDFFGHPWHIIPLNEADYGQEINFRVYSDVRLIGLTGRVRLGSVESLLLDIIKFDTDRWLIGVFLLLTSLYSFYRFTRNRSSGVILSFSLFSFATGLYILSWTQIKQLILHAPLFWSYILLVSLFLMPLAIAYFAEKVFGAGYRQIVRRLWQLHLWLTVVLLPLVLFSVVDFFTAIVVIIVFWFFDFLVLMTHIISRVRAGDREAWLFFVGGTFLSGFSVYDILTQLALIDSWPWTRPLNHWGMLAFTVTLALIIEHKLKSANSMLKNYSAELEAKNVELSRLDKLKDEFLANTSHELRTPLNGIIGITEAMLVKQPPGKAADKLDLIVTSGRRLSSLVDDILDFSSMRHGDMNLNIVPLNIGPLVDIALRIHEPLIRDKNLTALNNVSDAPTTMGDEARVQQILLNLLSNAIKFTASGSIKVDAQIKENMLVVAVSDTGIGIAAEDRAKVFENFLQLESADTKQFRGAGLGLSIAKSLVELQAGKIWLESNVGEGSTFFFSLPLAKNETPTENRPTSFQGLSILKKVRPSPVTAKSVEAPIEPVTRASDESYSILVVDDEPVNRSVITGILETDSRYHIVTAGNGPDALSIVASGQKIDLVILDLMMPGMSGFEVCSQLRETHDAARLPILILTAKNQISDLEQSFAIGANDYLTKPVSKNELLSRIKSQLALSNITAKYSRFVPQEFLHYLGRDDILSVNLGDQIQKDMTILFSDIRSFTALSEQMTPSDNFNFLNGYLRRVGPAIGSNKGFIDKYIGDAIMALFPYSAQDAVDAAVAMNQAVLNYNKDRTKKKKEPLAIGVGLHTGSLILGVLGHSVHMQTTVISDAVNLASRMEGLTKKYGATVVISDATMAALSDPSRFHSRFLDKVQVKGKNQPVTVYEIYSGDDPDIIRLKNETKSDFEEGINLYHSQQFAESTVCFDRVLKKFPADSAARLYMERAAYYLVKKPDEDWQGVERLDQK